MNWETLLIMAAIGGLVIFVVYQNNAASVAAAASSMGNSYADPVTGATVICAPGQVVKTWGQLNTPGCFWPAAIPPSTTV